MDNWGKLIDQEAACNVSYCGELVLVSVIR